MSLLDRGPHEVLVQLRRRDRDDLNAPIWVNDGAPISVKGSMQPLESDDRIELGLTVEDAWKFITRSWPGDVHCHVTWQGATYDQKGNARPRSTGSRRTRHVVVRLVAQSTKVRQVP